MVSCIFFNDPATTEIYTLSLHDALPIYVTRYTGWSTIMSGARILSYSPAPSRCTCRQKFRRMARCSRSEEHTSELQSQSNLVCRLLLEKKKQTQNQMHPRMMSTAPLPAG